MTLKKLMKNNFLLILFSGFCFSNNMECDKNKFNIIINDIQSYGSKLNIIVKQDTINATQILLLQGDILTVNLLNEKWSNFSINQDFSKEFAQGSSVPFEIPINQIDCIIEIDRPELLKEYAFIGLAGLVLWSMLSIFQLN